MASGLKLTIWCAILLSLFGCGGAETVQKAESKAVETVSIRYKGKEVSWEPTYARLAMTVACGTASLSPTETVRSYTAATNSRDVEGVKKLLTKNSLNMLADGARQSDMTVEEFIKSGKAAPPLEVSQYRNEKIEGDTASVEANYGGEWQKIVLVKEDGKWKIAFDKG